MIDNRSPRQLHENATGVPKESREVYQLTEKHTTNQSDLDIHQNFVNRNNELRSRKHKRNTKEAYTLSWNKSIETEQKPEKICRTNTLDEQQMQESKLNLDMEKSREGISKDKEKSSGGTKLRKAYQIALMLLDLYDFCKIGEQLYVFDMHEGYWKMIQESESNRTVRRIIPDDMCSAVNKSILYEIYEWLLMLAEEINAFPTEKRFYLNFKDCAVNWRTEDIIKERKSLYFTYALDVNYSDAENQITNKFSEFVDDVFGEDKKTKREFYKFLGLALSDIRDLKISIFLYGPSNSGKSVFLNLLRQLVGEKWCASLSFTQIGNEFAITQLLGKRLNLSGEVSGTSNKRLDIFKSLTGNDTITACFKGKDHFQFKNESLLVFACNSLPEVVTLGEFDSFLSRIIIFPFFKVKPREEWIDNLSELLMEDVGTILEVAMKGLQELEKDNFCFNETKAMKLCKQEFIEQYNSFALFADECIEKNPESKISSDEINKQYAAFCQSEGLLPLADNIWPQLLKQRYGCKSIMITEKDDWGEKRKRGYRGIQLKKKIESEGSIIDWR